MNTEKRNPGEPIENLAIGKIIEVDGSHVIAELDPGLTELSRVYAGETYPIGQFGSIVRIHFGRRLIYALVGRLRMKAEYEAERGVAPRAAADERVVEADLFGEGEWTRDEAGEGKLQFERGVATYPLPQQTVYLTPKSELRFIYGHFKGAVIQLGEHVGAGGAPCYADLNELLGKHTAVLGSTGAGKSAAVAAIIHSVIQRGQDAKYQNWKPQIVILDPHNEYGKAFKEHKRPSTDEGTLSLPYWLLNLDETIGLLIGKTEYAATSQANIVKNALLSARSSAAKDVLALDPDMLTVDALSQCNSWIVLRVANEADREHVRGMLPDSMAGLTKMLSGLRRQEAIFVGQAAMLPSRIMIRDLAEDQLPKSNDIDFDKGWQSDGMSEAQLKAVANRWRYQKR